MWKPILLELGSAIPLNGANYTYLLQVSSKTLALVGAAVTLLDAIATSMVSAATATAYIDGEFTSIPVPTAVLSIIILLGITCIALFRTRDSTTVTLAFTVIHVSYSAFQLSPNG
jgi:amino acid transporter